MNKRIGVLGVGAWGTALALHLARGGNQVISWGRNSPAEPRADLRTTTELSDLMGVQCLVFALPARTLAEFASEIVKLNVGVVLSASKGLVGKDGKTPLTFLSDRISCKLAVLSGPSFASDVLSEKPVSVVIASNELAIANDLCKLFSVRNFRAYSSADPLGVELGGIAKNVLAIACGVSDALGFGPSARAALITRGLAEMTRLAVSLGADAGTLSGLSGLGDLVMTATDDQSRNRRFGLLLGAGKNKEVALKEIGAEVEGSWSAELLGRLGQERGVELPITSLVVRLLNGEVSPHELAASLISRPLKQEFAGGS